MLVTVEQLKKFSGVYSDEDTVSTELLNIYIGSAQDIISSYVGFNPEENEAWQKTRDVENYLYSTDRQTFYSNPEMTIPFEVTEDIIISPTLIDNEYFYITEENYIEVPEIFKLVCLEIATLIQQEENSNIGVNSKSFAEGGSRSFLNVVDYTKYLARLSRYRKNDSLKM